MTDEQLSLKLFVVMNRALESVRKQVVKDIKRYKLNLSEFAVLEYLYHKGEQPIQLIGKKVLLASSSITYVIDKLEKKQLIERQACPTDRRVIFGKITDEGRALMDEIFPKHESAMAHIFSSLSLEEKEQMAEYLKRVGHHAEQL